MSSTRDRQYVNSQEDLDFASDDAEFGGSEEQDQENDDLSAEEAEEGPEELSQHDLMPLFADKPWPAHAFNQITDGLAKISVIVYPSQLATVLEAMQAQWGRGDLLSNKCAASSCARGVARTCSPQRAGKPSTSSSRSS
jgi:hypothetical protein